jgi:hypothetical protein
VTGHAHTCLPLGAADAAERYGVGRDAIQQRRWREGHGLSRDPMPDPDWTISGRPAWCAHTLDPWARRVLRWQSQAVKSWGSPVASRIGLVPVCSW